MALDKLCADASDYLKRAADIKHKINEGLTILSSEVETMTEEENNQLLTTLVTLLCEMDLLLCELMSSVLPEIELEEPNIAKALRIVLDELRSIDFKRELEHLTALRPSKQTSGTYSCRTLIRSA